MPWRNLPWHAASLLGVGLLFAGPASPPLHAQSAAALSGEVTSAEEGAMEGVLVGAKQSGSTITITVVTDQQGHYSFPAAKLAPGSYALRIRAEGYELDGRAPAAEVAAASPAVVDLKLRKARHLEGQLTNAEWMLSMPGSDAEKSSLLNCVGCHTLERPVASSYTAEEFVAVLNRMAGYAQVSTPLVPQKILGAQPLAASSEAIRRQAQFLSTINLSADSEWTYPLQTLPRLKGRSTHVIITEYGLPRPDMQPHDVILAEDGMAWFSVFGDQHLGRLDPHTGKVTEYAVDTFNPGAPVGFLDLEADRQGNLWLANMFQGAIEKFDRKNSTFQVFHVPPELANERTQINMVAAQNSGVDGKVWTFDVGSVSLYRVDLASAKFEAFAPFKNLPNGSPSAGGPHGIYGIASDSQNNVYFTDFADRSDANIGKIDAKTGKVTLYPLSTPFARPRRVTMDAQDRLWFAEYRGNHIGVLDTKTEKIEEWAVPTPWTGPYHLDIDKNGEVWTGGMTSDRIVRFDPKTNQAVEYPLPRETNIRRVFVDNSTSPVTFWTGSNHGASIVKLEPLD